MSATMMASATPQRIKRRYGLPYRGYTSSVWANACPPDMLWGAPGPQFGYRSVNLEFDPVEGKFFRRFGTLNVGGLAGIIEGGTGRLTAARARKMIGLTSFSIQDLAADTAYSTPCVLYTEESATVPKSALYLRSTIGSINYTLGLEFSANHYPGTNAATFNIKCVPYYRTTDNSWGRLSTAATRAYALAGSRNMQEVGDYIYFGCLDSLPLKWNKRYNESTASGSQNLRLMPTGNIPPLMMPTVATGTANATGVWRSGDLFFISVAYQMADGSVTAPIIPREINTYLATGLGRISLGASCDFITWSGIPIGPDGTVGRWLLRTPKYNSSPALGTPPDIRQLKTTAYISNNTQTTYTDPAGNDLGLVDRPDIIRFDRIWQPACRYLGNFDGRSIAGYTKINPAAVLLCPAQNVSDDTWSTTVYEYAVTGTDVALTDLRLYKNNTLNITITFGVTTIQNLVDRINATAGADRWVAQMVPGADGSVSLQGALGSIDITAGTTGDTADRVRAFSTSYPGLLFFGSTYRANFPTAKGRFFFTQGGPGVPSNLGDSWLAGNYRTGLASWGIFMGSAPLLDGCLLFFSKAVVLFRNIKSGKSGLDEDYHPDDLFTNLGCIAYDSIAHGDGWAGCLTARGYMVFDGTRGGVACISTDVWNPATQQGEWKYEIQQCRISVDLDNDAAHFHAKVIDGQLRVTYRSAAATQGGAPDAMLIYDFSPSASGSGLAQVLRPDGTPWGWSPPSLVPMSVLGQAGTASGPLTYGTVEWNDGSTCGRIDSTYNAIATGATDDLGSAFVTQAIGPLDYAESLKKKAAQELSIVYKSRVVSNLLLHFGRSNGNVVSFGTGGGLALPLTADDPQTTGPTRVVVPLPQLARSPSIANQVHIYDNGLAYLTELYGMELDEIVMASYT